MRIVEGAFENRLPKPTYFQRVQEILCFEVLDLVSGSVVLAKYLYVRMWFRVTDFVESSLYKNVTKSPITLDINTANGIIDKKNGFHYHNQVFMLSMIL